MRFRERHLSAEAGFDLNYNHRHSSPYLSRHLTHLVYYIFPASYDEEELSPGRFEAEADPLESVTRCQSYASTTRLWLLREPAVG